jgi:hypothetical protein
MAIVAASLTIVMATLAGLPLALLLRVESSRSKGRAANVCAICAEGFLFGLGFLTLLLLLLSVMHVAWSRATLLIPAAIVVMIAAILQRRGARAHVAVETQVERATPLTPLQRVVSMLAYAAAAASMIGYALYATIAPLWEFDFLSDWGLKARVFFESGGVDWRFLEQAFHQNVHPDYPLLLPLSYDVVAIVRGAWDDRGIGLLNVAFALALLAAAHRAFRDSTTSPMYVALGTFAMVSLVASPWIGIGEAPLIAFGTTALLRIREGVQHASMRSITAGALFLGLAAFVKNEGLTLIAAAAIGLIAAGAWRMVPRLWPAAAIALPWLVLRAGHSLATDIASGSLIARIGEHLRNPAPLIIALTEYPGGKPLLWLGVGLAVVATSRELARRERFALTALAVQFTCYIAAYLATPHDIEWHVKWSWERIVSHLMPMLVIVLLATLFRVIGERGEGANTIDEQTSPIVRDELQAEC